MVQLLVHDGMVDSAPDTVIVLTQNAPPVADAGLDQTVFVEDTVSLHGQGSRDADGDPLTYQWAFTAVPTGSAAVLSDSTAVQPTFTVDEPGTYVVQLIVHDGTVHSPPDTVVISTQNSRPVAHAGPDQAVVVGETVQLDGSASSDADQDALGFRWALTTVPEGSAAVLSEAMAASLAALRAPVQPRDP